MAAVLAIVAGFALTAVRPDPVLRSVRASQALLLEGRLDALRRGRPTAIVAEPRPSGARLVLRRGLQGDAIGDVCRAGTVVRAVTMDAGVVLTPLRDDLVWLPSGYGRRCDGSAAANGTVRFEGRRSTWALRISTAGRVRRERLA